MKSLIFSSLTIIFSFFLASCNSDEITNSNGNNYTIDYDLFIVRNIDSLNNKVSFTINMDGTGLKIFNDSLSVFSKVNMNKLLLSKSDYYTDKIYLADIKAGNLREITLGNDLYSYFHLSPDALKLSYIRISDNSLNIINTDGSANAFISNQNVNESGSSEFSPDSKKIAYYEYSSFNHLAVKLLISNLTGTYKKIIKDSIIGLPFSSLDWSADGKKLYFHDFSFYEHVAKIYEIDTSGNSLKLIGDGINPKISHDGNKISFINYTGNSNDIFIMNHDGTNTINITNTPVINEYYNKWSADCSKILYISGSNLELWIYDVNSQSSISINDSVLSAFWK